MSHLGPFETLSIFRDSRGVATITFETPEKHNAMSPQMIAELRRAADMLGEDDAVRVVVMTGDGKSFSAGADLNWMRAQFDASREQRIAEARALAEMLKALYFLPKPLIGRIQGQAFGGGLGLMAVCDCAVVADHARFGFTETRLGIIPATISPYVYARGDAGKLARVFASPILFSAREAVELGLAARAVPIENLDAEVDAEATPYLAAAPSAVARAKALGRSLSAPIDDALIARSVEALADAWESPEAREGVQAFFDKTKPRWA